MFSDKLFHSNSFYFLGIGGVSMSALAQLAHEKGARVRGYDASDGPFVRKLREKGIEVSLNGEQEITEDTVVYTGAIPPNNLQMDAARRAGRAGIRASPLRSSSRRQASPLQCGAAVPLRFPSRPQGPSAPHRAAGPLRSSRNRPT